MQDMPVPAMPFVTGHAAVRPRVRPDSLAESPPPLNEAEPVSALVREALAHWHAIRGDAPLPLRRALDPVDIPGLLANSELLDVLRGPMDFRYRLIGDAIDRISRDYISRDYYVGKRVSAIPGQRPPSQIFTLYAETVRRRAPVCVTLPYVGRDPLIDHVEAVTMPLSGDGMTVDVLWGGVVVPVETAAADR